MVQAAGQARRLTARRGGFTLIEALLSGIILAMFAAAMAAGVSQATVQLQHDRDTLRAAQALDELLTRTSLVGPATLSITGPLAGELDETFTWSLAIEQQPLSDLYDVTATVAWIRRGNERSVSAATRLFDPASSASGVLPWEALEP